MISYVSKNIPNPEGSIIIKLFKKIFGRRNSTHSAANVIPPEQHNITPDQISPNAIKVLRRLYEGGYKAYLVGGCIRDLLLGITPKDFDIATDAEPEQIRALFRNCILIGRRFRLAHIRFGYEVIEVATFRAAESGRSQKKRPAAPHGMLLHDNVYGTIEEDAWRRDFTINALYYDLSTGCVIDYCNGMTDLKQRILRIIGDPAKRFHEDPVRLLRIIRFAGKLNGQIPAETAALMKQLAPTMEHVPAARLFDEVLKLFHSGKAVAILDLLQEYHLFAPLFPQTAACLHDANSTTKKLITIACQNTDARIQADKSVSPAFLFACMLWAPLNKFIHKYTTAGMLPSMARDKAAQEVISLQIKRISVPKRYTIAVREVWNLQPRLEKPLRRLVPRIIEHPRFRAAYDFLLLRADSGEAVTEQAKWWTAFYNADGPIREQMISQLPQQPKPKRKK